jgi:hypothetical protein
MRNTPEALPFIRRADAGGVSSVVAERDGPVGDCSHAPAELRPDPNQMIAP